MQRVFNLIFAFSVFPIANQKGCTSIFENFQQKPFLFSPNLLESERPGEKVFFGSFFLRESASEAEQKGVIIVAKEGFIILIEAN